MLQINLIIMKDKMDNYPKANILHRFIAKFIDLLIVSALYKIVAPIGFFAGITYLFISDGFSHGRSVGKKLIGLQTLITEQNKACLFRESIIRNFPFVVAYICIYISYIGWIFSIVIITIEFLLIIGNDKGLRLGDEMAKTQVLDEGIIDVDIFERRDRWV